MHVTRAYSFRCHYRRAVPGQPPMQLFIQLLAADAVDARTRAEAITGRLVDRVEPAPAPTAPVSPVPSTLEV